MKNTVSITGELLSDSKPTSDYDWSNTFLDFANNECNQIDSALREQLLHKCSIFRHFDANTFLNSYGTQPLVGQAIAFLDHHAFQFNSKRRFRESPSIRNNIADALKEDHPLDIVIPIFCVIGNRLKRLDPTVVTFAEECTLQSLENIAQSFKAIIGLHLHFQIISDAIFYIRPLGADPAVAAFYLKTLAKYVADNSLSNLTVHDMSLLPSDRLRQFEDAYLQARANLANDPGAGLEDKVHRNWVRSMASTITTRDLPASYEEIAQTFRHHDFSTPFGQEVLSRTERAFVDYRALKYALNELHWDETNFPGSIRATIHQKKEPVLGLRIYPEYKKSSRLLPYHGVAVVSQDSETKPIMRIEPEINVFGRSRYRRYTLPSGMTDMYIDTNSDAFRGDEI